MLFRSGNTAVELFSGMVYCRECGAAMVRKTVPSGKKKYVYYICAAHKNKKTCSAHSLRDSVLEELVLESVRGQVQQVLDMEKLLELAEMTMLQKAGIQKQQGRLSKKQEEISRYQRLLDSLYENLVDGVINREEYQNLKRKYTTLLTEAEGQAEQLHTKLTHAMKVGTQENGWIEQFKKYQNLERLDRAAVVFLVERIFIGKDRQVEIVYNWQDEYQWLVGLLLQVQGIQSKQEAKKAFGKEKF